MRFLIAFASLIVIAHSAPQSGYGYAPQQPQPQQQGGNKYLPPATAAPAPAVHKQFYLIAAPEDNDNLSKSKHFVLGRPQKNYRVVFIKAPSSNSGKVRLSAEHAPQEEKTVIYVLSKKEHELDVNDIATPAPTVPSKPEVFFIKYKTEEEAHAAQKEIQNQYDQLGGTNEFSNEGYAPVTSVVGSLDGQAADGGYDYKQIQGSAPVSQYLPPISSK